MNPRTAEPYLSAPGLASAVAAVVLGTLLWNIVRNILTSPIPSSVPGPFLARITSKWILLVDLSGQRAQVVDALHKKHGPVVRLAPDELSFAGRDAVKAIYGAGATVVKSPAYNLFGKRGMFQMQDPREHRERQRRIAHIFSAASLQQTEPLVQAVVGRTVATLAASVGAPVDALHWCRMMALDVAGAVLMGKEFGAFDGDGAAPVYVRHLDNAYIAWALNGLAPALVWLLERLPIQSLQRFLAAREYVYSYGEHAVQQYLKTNGRASSRRTLISKMIAGNPETGAEPLPDADIVIEVSNNTFAAVDSTGNTAAYTLYRLACVPEWQQRLRREIRASGAKEKGFQYQSLQALPVLNAVLVETLRLHPAVPTGLPRLTRDATIFPDPDKFDPGRWLSGDGAAVFAGTPVAQEMTLVWGGRGPRACSGQYMAAMEVKLLLAQLVDRFQVGLQGEATHGEMEMTAHFHLIPKGRRCGLVFDDEEVSDETT
ncbi:cytochrome P450 [Lasiosphaeria miniovina]|uniref:Cytochrome P450 n=1 Tax=Lasiosphaeria miniovina TaxID=1954250 RepID=A0AA40DK10_9PEZI|nr:cytochrome P450 [Lasiosphaeria miniovina]KAK0703642.1 cytochrome P450 [Lasiosphaeria miniovina]